MTDALTPADTAQISTPETLEDLWAKAEGYGRVCIHSGEFALLNAQSYVATIKFNTIEGTSVEARSQFDQTLRAALEQAIDRAEQIRGQIK